MRAIRDRRLSAGVTPRRVIQSRLAPTAAVSTGVALPNPARTRSRCEIRFVPRNPRMRHGSRRRGMTALIELMRCCSAITNRDLMPFSRTILPQRSNSALRCAPISSGVPAAGIAPDFDELLPHLRIGRAPIDRGIELGDDRAPASGPGRAGRTSCRRWCRGSRVRPGSARRAASRIARASTPTPSGFSLPPWICDSSTGTSANNASTWPPRRSVRLARRRDRARAGISRRPADWKSSSARCGVAADAGRREGDGVRASPSRARQLLGRS